MVTEIKLKDTWLGMFLRPVLILGLDSQAVRKRGYTYLSGREAINPTRGTTKKVGICYPTDQDLKINNETNHRGENQK